MFLAVGSRQMFDDNLWLSVPIRQVYSRFNRVQRLWTIAAMLFMNMIVSAMFFQTPEKNPIGVKLGPLTLTYKQVYVGFVSAIATSIPLLSLALIFKFRRVKQTRRRRHQAAYGTEPVTTYSLKHQNSCYLPWWFIYVGYLLIVGSIGSSMAFTFLYSLDWGAEVTGEWILSFFVGVLESIIIIEPAKVWLNGMVNKC